MFIGNVAREFHRPSQRRCKRLRDARARAGHCCALDRHRSIGQVGGIGIGEAHRARVGQELTRLDRFRVGVVSNRRVFGYITGHVRRRDHRRIIDIHKLNCQHLRL